MKSGVYKIYNSVSGKTYIGSSENLNRRLKDHKSYLRINKHQNKHLQSAYNKYGKDAFEFTIIEYCEIYKLAEREQYWLDRIPLGKRYNKRKIVETNRGLIWTAEQKEKLKNRPTNKGKKLGSLIHDGSIKKGQRLSPRTEFKKGVDTWNKGTKGICKPNKTSYKPTYFELVSPDNILYTGYNLYRFSIEMELSYTSLQKVAFYKIKDNFNGWRLPKENEQYDGIGLWLDAA